MGSNLKKIAIFAAIALSVSCGPADDVEVQPLPDLERPSREARLGLPEITGAWNFAGWEVLRGDSVTLDRTFPSFGTLQIATQRLDSIAGTFLVAGGPTPVVGEVRRDGTVALVTLPDSFPLNYLTGSFESDTLWMELSSVLAAGEWPQDSRAAFVRDTPGEPIAWVRGARPTPEPPADSLASAAPSGADSILVPGEVPPSAEAVSTTQPPSGTGDPPARPPTGSAPPAPSVTGPPPAAPSTDTGIASPAPSPPEPAVAPEPEQPDAEAEPAPEPEADPDQAPEEPEPEVPPIPEPDLPPLLGDPVQ